MTPARDSRDTDGAVQALQQTLVAWGLTPAVMACAFLVVPGLFFFEKEAFIVPKALALAVFTMVSAVLSARILASRERLAVAWVDLLVAGYFLWALVAWVASPRQATSLLEWMSAEVCAGVLFFATALAARHGPVRRRLFTVLVIAATALAVVALLEAVGVKIPWSTLRRPASTLGNRNFLGGYLAVVLPVALVWSVARPTAARLVPIVIIVTAMVLTRCRSAWAGAGLAAVIMVGLDFAFRTRTTKGARTGLRARLRVVGAAATGLAIALAVPWPGLRWAEASPFLSTARRMAEYDLGSGQVRVNQARVALAIARESPLFGAGPRSWDDASSALAHAATGQHAVQWQLNPTPSSDALRILAELGFVGLVIAALVAASVFFSTLRTALRRPARAALSVALLGSLSAALVHASLDAPLFRAPLVALFAVVAGLARSYATTWQVRVPRGVALVVPGLAAVSLIAPSMLFAAAVRTRVARATPADMAASQRIWPRMAATEWLVKRLKAKPGCDPADSEIARLERWAPHHWGAYRIAASCAKITGNDALAKSIDARIQAFEPHYDPATGEIAEARTPTEVAVEEALLAQYPVPIIVTNDGRRVALKTRARNGFEVTVVDLATKKVVARDLSDDTQLGLAFRPDGEALALLESSGGRDDFRLFVLDFARGARRRLAMPPSRSAAAALRWSPDGARVATLLQGAKGTEIVLVDARTADAPMVRLRSPAADSEAAWTPDGHGLAMIVREDPSAITIFDTTGNVTRRLAVGEHALIHELSFAADGHALLATARFPEGDFQEVVRIDLDSERVTRVSQLEGGARPNDERPIWLSNTAVIHDHTTGRARLVGGRELTPALGERAIARFDVFASLTSDRATGLAYTANGPPELVALRLDDAHTDVLYTPDRPTHPPWPLLVPEHAVVGEGRDVSHLQVWRAPSSRAPVGALVLVHGGPHLQSPTEWDAGVAWLTSQGVHVIASDYRGSRGYGASFEGRGTLDDRAADVVRAAHYAEASLGVPAARVAVLGQSYGARLVATAAARGELADHVVVLVSMVPGALATASSDHRPRVILAYHGENDPIAPLNAARDELERAFGAEAMGPPGGRFSVLPREGHGLHRPSSWAKIYGDAFDALTGNPVAGPAASPH